jgi:inorganic phosphate transporter, PiT family
VEAALLAVAALFAVLNGVNDGGTLVAMGLKVPALRPLAALLVLTAAVVTAPVVLGTAVATTLAERLVAFEGDTGQVALLAAIVAAVGVVAVLAQLSLPTSLTLALVGGITGAGWASGLPMSWTTVGFVLVMAAVAPAAGGVLAFWLTRLGRRLSAPAAYRKVRRAHVVAFGLQCLAYGANDGQKMLAVFAVAAGAASVTAVPLLLGVIGLLFLAGSILGLRRLSGTVATGLVPTRPASIVVAELASGTAVLASAGLGAPVSMTQAVAGGLVGTGVSEAYRRVRWKMALQVATAWALTLPTAFAVAAVTGAAATALASARG